MLAGSARISRSTPAGTASRHGAASCWTKTVDRSSPNRRGARNCNRGREVTAPRASFFETLFSGGSKTTGAAQEQAAELVDQLLQEIGGRRNKPVIGPNEAIDDLINELQRVPVMRNPARSPSLLGVYDVRYLAQLTIPPMASNVQVALMENYFFNQFNVPALGVFPATASREGTRKTTGPNTWMETFVKQTVDKGILGKEVEEISGRQTFDVLFFDENVLIVRLDILLDIGGVKSSYIQIYQKNSKSLSEVKTSEPVVKSDISPGDGLKGVARKTSAATKAERTYEQQAKAADKKKAEAEKKAREEALRLEKEKAAAEREEALALKAKIKESVEGYQQRLKDAQESKKEAATALKNFERENAEVLKQVSAFRKEMASIDDEIASLTEEANNLAAQEKGYAEEIRNCRRELADVGKQLATF